MERQAGKIKTGMILSKNENPEVVLIGGGIMSTTLAILLKELMPMFASLFLKG
jgi:hypothetical protein